jgi:predicted PurR-regulated permease PerM
VGVNAATKFAVPKQRHWRYRLVIAMYRLVRWAQRRLPPGVRTLVGVALMIGGVLGFLPVLGFWMFPLGVAVAITDVPPLRRRLEHWLNETRRRYHVDLINGLRQNSER